jgi:hypothetical protein
VRAVFVGVAALYYLLLGSYCLVRPGSVVLEREDSFFDMDAGARLHQLTHPKVGMGPALYPHPAIPYVYRPPALVATALLSMRGVPFNHAMVYVARGMMVLMLTTGAYAMLRIGEQVRLTGARLMIVMPIYLFASANVTGVVPEAWAFSMALLPLAFLLFLRRTLAATLLLVPVVLLAIGTTLTNAAFAVILGLVLLRDRVPGRWVYIGAGALFAAILAPWLVRGMNVAGEAYGGHYWHFRILATPLRMLGSALLSPVIAQTPHVESHIGLSVFPFDATAYGIIAGIGVTAFVALLAWCARIALSDESQRTPALVLVAWIGCSVVQHGIWGGQPFVYSGHWMWALMGLVFLGASKIPIRYLAPLAGCVIAGQLAALYNIGMALRQV